VMRMLTSRPSDAICELVGSRPYRFVEGRREANLTFANTDTLDQLLLRRFGGKVGRGLTAELSGRHDFLIEWSFALPRSSRVTGGKRNPSIHRGIIAKHKQMSAVEQRGYGAWT
jgi:hypothetical protein